MKKKTLVLSKKLFLNRKTIVQLNANEQNNLLGGDSLLCNTQRPAICTTEQTTPDVAICILTAAPTIMVACPPPQVTNGCTIAPTNG